MTRIIVLLLWADDSLLISSVVLQQYESLTTAYACARFLLLPLSFISDIHDGARGVFQFLLLCIFTSISILLLIRILIPSCLYMGYSMVLSHGDNLYFQSEI
jgi:hypothetical protein